MATLSQKLSMLATDRVLRKRIIFVLVMLAVFRVLAAIPIPGIDAAQLSKFLSNNQFLGILNVFSGGGLSHLSVIMLGVGPYITGSIIMQLLTIMVPSLKRLYHEEGEAGRRKFTQYSRILTVPLAILQAFGLMVLFERQGVLPHFDLFQQVVALSVAVGGSLLLTWVGELMSEYGISNGISIIIFAGIVANLPREISQMYFNFDQTQIPYLLLFVVVGVLIIAGVVMVTEAERPVPVTYAKQVRGGQTYGGTQTYIPLRINQAGVMPIIFALSILLFPQLIGGVLSGMHAPIAQSIGHALLTFTTTGWLYASAYFVLVVLFTYFYTAVTFEPHTMATNLQKNGAFIPGIRPGEATEQYVGNVVSRITLVGALFLGVIAVLPLAVQAFMPGVSSIALGGTALLIVISVVLDIIKKTDAQLSLREY